MNGQIVFTSAVAYASAGVVRAKMSVHPSVRHILVLYQNLHLNLHSPKNREKYFSAKYCVKFEQYIYAKKIGN